MQPADGVVVCAVFLLFFWGGAEIEIEKFDGGEGEELSLIIFPMFGI